MAVAVAVMMPGGRGGERSSPFEGGRAVSLPLLIVGLGGGGLLDGLAKGVEHGEAVHVLDWEEKSFIKSTERQRVTKPRRRCKHVHMLSSSKKPQK